MNPYENVHIHAPFRSPDIVVHFIGDTLLGETREIDYHWNPGWEICLTPYGRGIFRIDEVPYAVSGGHLFHTRASERHGGWPSADDPVRILYVCFSPGANPSERWREAFRDMEALSSPLARDVDDLTGLHLRLLRLARACGRNDDRIFEETLYLFLLSFLHCHQATPATETPRDGVIIHALLRLLDASDDRPVSLQALAAQLHYSVPWLTRIFRRETGWSILAYHRRLRMERARLLLADPARTVTQIAGELGFGSIHHFSRAFRQVYGMSPNDMRGIDPAGSGVRGGKPNGIDGFEARVKG